MNTMNSQNKGKATNTKLLRLNLPNYKGMLFSKDIEEQEYDFVECFYHTDLSQTSEDPDFLFCKGYRYYHKINVPQRDRELGVALMKSAADAGLFEAMIALSHIYLSFSHGKNEKYYENPEEGYKLREKALSLLLEEYKNDPSEKNALTYLDALIRTGYNYFMELSLHKYPNAYEISKEKTSAAVYFALQIEKQYTSREGIITLSKLFADITDLPLDTYYGNEKYNENYFYKKSVRFAKKAYRGTKDIDELEALAEKYSWYYEFCNNCDWWNIFSKIKAFSYWTKSLSTYKKRLRILKKLFSSNPEDYDYEMMSTYSDIADMYFPVFRKKYLQKAIEMCKLLINNDDSEDYDGWHERYDRLAQELGILDKEEGYGLKYYYTKEIERLKSLIESSETTDMLKELALAYDRLCLVYFQRDDLEPMAELLRKGFDCTKRICEITGAFEDKMYMCEYIFTTVCMMGGFRYVEKKTALKNSDFIEIFEEALALIGNVNIDSLECEDLSRVGYLYHHLHYAYTQENNNEKAEYFADKYQYCEDRRKLLEENN